MKESNAPAPEGEPVVPPKGEQVDPPKSEPGTSPGGEPAEESTQWMSFLNLGWMIVANMALFVGMGMWLDRRFRTTPWLLMAGVFLAFAASGYTIYLAVKRIESSERKKPRQRGGTPSGTPGPAQGGGPA